MHNDTLIDDLRAAFTAQADSLPHTDRAGQPHYRPRTTPVLLGPAGVALAGVAVAGAAVAALATGTGPGNADPAAAGPTITTTDGRLTVDLAQYRITLPEGYSLATGICEIDPFAGNPETLAIRKLVSPDGTCVSIVISGKPFSAPEGARSVTVGSYQGWTMTGPDGISVGVAIPATDGGPVRTLLFHVMTVDGHPSLEDVLATLARLQLTWPAAVTTG